uniref:Uncharacterized protein n=1 Tax=Heterorhabditis bacteriophora TaxID=37862 RepID=A0A1I7XN73_HETBA
MGNEVEYEVEVAAKAKQESIRSEDDGKSRGERYLNGDKRKRSKRNGDKNRISNDTAMRELFPSFHKIDTSSSRL